MTTTRASRYPPPVAEVLAGARCEHGELAGCCALCRRAAELSDEQKPSEPVKPRPARRRALDGDDLGQPDEPEPVAPQLRPPEPRYRDGDPRAANWWDW
jgi:hypothetical protein